MGLPWAWVKDAERPTDISLMTNEMPNRGLTGYCINLLERLAQGMDFDYEIVAADNNEYGKKRADGTWSGVVGDLISGEIDISVAALTMTTEREEVIDFVAPYFDQSGISIILVITEEPATEAATFFSLVRELATTLRIALATPSTSLTFFSITASCGSELTA